MTKSSDVLEAIIWPEKAPLQNLEHWDQGVEMVRMLCSIGTVISWNDGVAGRDTYVHMPRRYEIEGIHVDFLPNWNFYQVGDYLFDVRNTIEEIHLDIAAVKTTEIIKARGGRFSRREDD